MIRTLAKNDQLSRQCDVLVIGAGTVGLIVATQLAQSGRNVICLESGQMRQEADEHPLNEVVHTRLSYEGAAHGRFRCLGGTSTRWGGALIPFARADVEGAQWPIPYDDIVRFVPEVEALFGLTAGRYEAEDVEVLGEGDFVPRLAKWPPFGKRNVANLVGKTAHDLPNLEIWLGATATSFTVANERLTKVTAQSLDGGQLHVEAGEVVFCAGAIETTRLLLLLDHQNEGRVFAQDDQLGRNFSDHLSLIVASFTIKNRSKFNRFAGFRFMARGTMRNLRFELSNETPLRATTPPCFAHIAFETDENSGFGALRNLLRYLQQRRMPPLSIFLALAKALPWLTRMAWWRLVERRLLYPDGAPVHLHMVLEQQPRPENQIRLSTERTDGFGLPLAEIDWDITSQDFACMEGVTASFARAWVESSLSQVADLVRRPEAQIRHELADSGGIFHPVGSTRMGHDAKMAVVDRDLRPFRLRNVTVLATSVLPVSGGANPTMMLLLLAFRFMERLRR